MDDCVEYVKRDARHKCVLIQPKEVLGKHPRNMIRMVIDLRVLHNFRYDRMSITLRGKKFKAAAPENVRSETAWSLSLCRDL